MHCRIEALVNRVLFFLYVGNHFIHRLTIVWTPNSVGNFLRSFLGCCVYAHRSERERRRFPKENFEERSSDYTLPN